MPQNDKGGNIMTNTIKKGTHNLDTYRSGREISIHSLNNKNIFLLLDLNNLLSNIQLDKAIEIIYDISVKFFQQER